MLVSQCRKALENKLQRVEKLLARERLANCEILAVGEQRQLSNEASFGVILLCNNNNIVLFYCHTLCPTALICHELLDRRFYYCSLVHYSWVILANLYLYYLKR